MNTWLRAQRAEMLKLKGTFGLWLVVLMPLAVAILITLTSGHPAPQAKTPSGVISAKVWLDLGDHMFFLWTMLMAPLFVTLQTAWLAGLEDNNRQWKYLLALPLPRSNHYLVKLTTMVAMLLCAYLLLLALVGPAGWILMIAAPKTGFAGLPPLGMLFVPAASSLAASLLLVALQSWIALRWHSFSVAISVGVVATIAGFLLANSKYGKFFPWSMPAQPFMRHGNDMVFTTWLGVIGGLVVGVLGLYDFLRRDSV
jgi:hypothetical protein